MSDVTVDELRGRYLDNLAYRQELAAHMDEEFAVEEAENERRAASRVLRFAKRMLAFAANANERTVGSAWLARALRATNARVPWRVMPHASYRMFSTLVGNGGLPDDEVGDERFVRELEELLADGVLEAQPNEVLRPSRKVFAIVFGGKNPCTHAT